MDRIPRRSYVLAGKTQEGEANLEKFDEQLADCKRRIALMEDFAQTLEDNPDRFTVDSYVEALAAGGDFVSAVADLEDAGRDVGSAFADLALLISRNLQAAHRQQLQRVVLMINSGSMFFK